MLVVVKQWVHKVNTCKVPPETTADVPQERDQDNVACRLGDVPDLTASQPRSGYAVEKQITDTDGVGLCHRGGPGSSVVRASPFSHSTGRDRCRGKSTHGSLNTRGVPRGRSFGRYNSSGRGQCWTNNVQLEHG